MFSERVSLDTLFAFIFVFSIYSALFDSRWKRELGTVDMWSAEDFDL